MTAFPLHQEINHEGDWGFTRWRSEGVGWGKGVPGSFLPAQILSNACEFGIYIVFTVVKIWPLLEIYADARVSFSAVFGVLQFIFLN